MNVVLQSHYLSHTDGGSAALYWYRPITIKSNVRFSAQGRFKTWADRAGTEPAIFQSEVSTSVTIMPETSAPTSLRFTLSHLKHMASQENKYEQKIGTVH